MLLSDALVVDVAEEEKSARAALCMFTFAEKVENLHNFGVKLTDIGRDLLRARAPLSFGYFVVLSVVHVPRARLFVLVFFRGPRFV